MADVVAEVTDDKSLPKAERKRRQVETAAPEERACTAPQDRRQDQQPACPDREPAARDWDTQRVAEYPEWAEQVVARCRGLNRRLEQAFDAALAEVRAAIAARAA